MSEGLAQGPYVAATVGVEPMTLRTKDVDSTNAPHTPHIDVYHKQQLLYINSCNHLIKVLSLHRDSICHSPPFLPFLKSPDVRYHTISNTCRHNKHNTFLCQEESRK